MDRTVSREYGGNSAFQDKVMAVPVRCSRTSRSARRISLVAVGTGRREPELERPRRAIRVVAWARATARMELGKSRSSAKAGLRRMPLKKSAKGIFRECRRRDLPGHASYSKTPKTRRLSGRFRSPPSTFVFCDACDASDANTSAMGTRVSSSTSLPTNGAHCSVLPSLSLYPLDPPPICCHLR